MNFTLETAIFAALLSFIANIIICPLFIPVLKRIKFGQHVRDDGPKSHLQKSGTPTMGGIIIIISFLIGSVFFLNNNLKSVLVVFATISFGFIGFIDDYIKVVKKRSLGFRALPKFLLQLLAATIFLFLLSNLGDGYYNLFLVPFTTNMYINTGILFIPISLFIILGTVNGVNITDGLDGLASGVTVLVVTFFVFAAYGLYNNDILPIIGAAAGSLLGFLLFNTYPAKIFMGDTGSLALGGFIAAIAVVLRMPLFLAIVGLIYVVETASVIIQVLYFKFTKGKRFFKMAPLHHHFELSGIPESKVVAIFYIVTVAMCLIGFLATRGFIDGL
ncbi:MAG: phospho-N-acetylmuramoyl-pentapeptide-transferase [Defluviitaleaceae bacterium]|nr:phospho-N-acetylmuramoyl-pentapeptide-transferase [Defluviitaleaceae bacterium]